MNLSFLYLSLLPLTVSPEVLKVDPDSHQFFSGEFIELSCDESWSLKRTRTGSTQVQNCGTKEGDFGFPEGSSCVIINPLPSDSGLYWCESAAGDRSPQRPLSVTDKNLILDFPALPVAAGSDITLRCRIRTGSGLSPVLMKDGTVVHNGPEWNFIVSKEHEGEYICRDKRGGASEKRRLQVTEATTEPRSLSPSPFSSSLSPPHSPSVWWLLRPLLVSSPYSVCTVLLVLVYRGQRRTGSRRVVSMETGQEEAEYDDVGAEVTTEHSF